MTTNTSRTAAELYDHDTKGRQRWARIEDGAIKTMTYSDGKPDDRAWVPVRHVDSEPFDIATQWRLAPTYAIGPDEVILTFPVVAKGWEHA